MRPPGFTAEASLYRTALLYRGNSSGISQAGSRVTVVLQAGSWGPLSGACLDTGGTQYSADMPSGSQTWVTDCYGTYATQCPVQGTRPDQCMFVFGTGSGPDIPGTVFGMWNRPNTPCQYPWCGCGGACPPPPRSLCQRNYLCPSRAPFCCEYDSETRKCIGGCVANCTQCPYT
jgi:hypothetical protein